MPQQFYSKLAGVTAFNEDVEKRRSRQSIIKRMVEPGDDVVPERESHNIYDKNAIAVFVCPVVDDAWGEGDYQIGYLNRKVASELAPLMDRGYEFVYKFTEIIEVEGGKNFLGVNISITVFTPEEMKATRKRSPVSNKILDSPIRNLLNKTSKKYFKIIFDGINQIWRSGKNGKIAIGCVYFLVISLLCSLIGLLLPSESNSTSKEEDNTTLVAFITQLALTAQTPTLPPVPSETPLPSEMPIPGETLHRVDWSNFLTDNVYMIAGVESLFLHPALSE